MPTVNTQVDDIHAMLPSGEESIRLESHTLILWGLAIAFASLTSYLFFSYVKLSNPALNGPIYITFYALVFLVTGFFDFKLTQRAFLQRDESFPFIYAQLRKVFWMFMGLTIVVSIGSLFISNWRLNIGSIYIFIGLSLYLYGLFSEKLLLWVGLALILIGSVCITILFAGQVYLALKLAVFGVGFPILAFVLDKPNLRQTAKSRSIFLFAWLLLVLGPALVTHLSLKKHNSTLPPEAPLLTLEEYQKQTTINGKQIVRLPKDTEIPIHLHIKDGFFNETFTSAAAPLVLSKQLDLVLLNGELEPWYRVEGGPWKHRRDIRYEDKSRVSSPILTREEGLYMDFNIYVDAGNPR